MSGFDPWVPQTSSYFHPEHNLPFVACKYIFIFITKKSLHLLNQINNFLPLYLVSQSGCAELIHSLNEDCPHGSKP